MFHAKHKPLKDPATKMRPSVKDQLVSEQNEQGYAVYHAAKA